MRCFWDYRGESLRQIRAAMTALAGEVGDPLKRVSDFRDAIGRSRYFVKTYLLHMKSCNVRLSYTVPDRLLRVEVEADEPSSIYREKFAPILSKHLKEIRRKPVPEIPYIN